MTQVITPAAGREAACPRSQQLAESLEGGLTALLTLAGTLTDAEWAMPIPHDGRTVGVVVHHVASVYPIEIQLAQMLAAGKPVTGVTWADVHAMNAAHARENAAVTKTDAMRLLALNGAAAAAAVRALTDEELGRAASNSLYDDAVLTCQHMIEDHAVRHSTHHLAAIRRAIGR